MEKWKNIVKRAPNHQIIEQDGIFSQNLSLFIKFHSFLNIYVFEMLVFLFLFALYQVLRIEEHVHLIKLSSSISIVNLVREIVCVCVLALMCSNCNKIVLTKKN